MKAICVRPRRRRKQRRDRFRSRKGPSLPWSQSWEETSTHFLHHMVLHTNFYHHYTDFCCDFLQSKGLSSSRSECAPYSFSLIFSLIQFSNLMDHSEKSLVMQKWYAQNRRQISSPICGRTRWSLGGWTACGPRPRARSESSGCSSSTASER